MPAPISAADELHDLHDEFVWEVNAAVGRDEDAVVERLSREHTDRALRIIVDRFRRAS
jgi:hypothetical protein